MFIFVAHLVWFATESLFFLIISIFLVILSRHTINNFFENIGLSSSLFEGKSNGYENACIDNDVDDNDDVDTKFYDDGDKNAHIEVDVDVYSQIGDDSMINVSREVVYITKNTWYGASNGTTARDGAVDGTDSSPFSTHSESDELELSHPLIKVKIEQLGGYQSSYIPSPPPLVPAPNQKDTWQKSQKHQVMPISVRCRLKFTWLNLIHVPVGLSN